MIFARSVDEGLIGLIRRADTLTAESDRGAAFVALLTDDPDAGAERLRAVAAETKVSIPLTISVDGSKGPKDYRLDPAAKTIAFVYAKEGRIQAAFRFDEIGDAELAQVVAAWEKAVGD